MARTRVKGGGSAGTGAAAGAGIAGGGAGGIMGSGIMGMIGGGVVCPSTDTSFYCTVIKYFQLMIIFFMTVGIVYFVGQFLYRYYMDHSRRSRK